MNLKEHFSERGLTYRKNVFLGVLTVCLLALLLVGRIVADLVGSNNEEISRPWTAAELSNDGYTLTLMVEPPGDPSCEKFVRIDVEHNGDTATAAAVYRRTDQEFCIVPCALNDVPRTVELEEPLTGVKIIPAKDTVRSCR